MPNQGSKAIHIGAFLTVRVCLVSGDIFLLNKGVIVSERHDTTRHGLQRAQNEHDMDWGRMSEPTTSPTGGQRQGAETGPQTRHDMTGGPGTSEKEAIELQATRRPLSLGVK